MDNDNDKNTEINKRISEIREYFCNGNNIEFSKKLGLSTPRTSNLCNKEPNVGNGILEKILKLFPEVSRTWLYFGEGPMLTPTNTNNQSNIHVEGDNIINGSSKNTMDGFDRLLDIISSQQKTIQELTEQNKILTRLIAEKL